MKKKSKLAGMAAQFINEWVVEFYMLVFERLKKEHPEMARDLETDYGKWMRAYEEIMKEKGGSFTIADIKKKAPNNRWATLITEVMLQIQDKEVQSGRWPLSEEERGKLGKHLRKEAARRFSKLDVH